MYTYLENPSGGVYRYSQEHGLEWFVLQERAWRDVNAQLPVLRDWLDPVPLSCLPIEVQEVERA